MGTVQNALKLAAPPLMVMGEFPVARMNSDPLLTVMTPLEVPLALKIPPFRTIGSAIETVERIDAVPPLMNVGASVLPNAFAELMPTEMPALIVVGPL